jgi:hypothetical protein
MIYQLLPPDNPILKVPLSDVNFDNFSETFHLTPQELYDNLI